mgnify:CR=1 FL=1
MKYLYIFVRCTTKEEILAEMKEKYQISDEKMDEYMKPVEVKAGESCSMDDEGCITCGS